MACEYRPIPAAAHLGKSTHDEVFLRLAWTRAPGR